VIPVQSELPPAVIARWSLSNAPQESERLLFLSLDYTRQGQKAIRMFDVAISGYLPYK
jgi:hypothetical protein